MIHPSREADLAAEGEPEKEFNVGIAGRLPKKTTAGGALVRNSEGLILFLEAVYKPTLEIPGGVAEFDESPLDAARREAREEIGIDIEIGPALVIDWIPATGVWHDGVMFIFDGGVLTDEQIAQITLDDTEARRFQFMTLDQASDRMRPSMVRRIACAQEALRQGAPIYAEFGRVPDNKAAGAAPVDSTRG
ncbi:NUDIX hydrolase [Kribbella solani]|uniref:NUDIX hydrolase n=1 Tax=Kribbella solani TaxID=236067 RepID=UPI0029B0306F|nr:NUDIX hydrolase [Kribbella solani]MDX2969758.1 NUDIX hydrolase [Kribbella solani]